ncbi:mycofactocin oligosaccharide methyltransferase MftM [Haloechinothrix salitolerans]|uniref:Mycofactocin oligosaccharide methyltransferase MftM n=1 Tax=Haloechinothrix salitolerans TaxID=926830 RepID=A0ABW2C304_9PSEU
MNAVPRAALDPLSPVTDRHYQDELVEVLKLGRGQRPQGPGETIATTAHFQLRKRGRRLEVSHWLRPDQLDNDLVGLLHAELFSPGWLSGNDVFEHVVTGIVRSTVSDPLLAWHTFYANTLAKIRRTTVDDGEPSSVIAGMVPVYERALEIVPPGSVLDLGSCFGFFPLLLAERGDTSVIASDLVPASMRLLATIARARHVPLATLACDAASVPLPNRAVDTVTLLHLLEHLEPADGDRVVAEAVRLASIRVVVAVPFEEEPAPIYGHVRTFDRSILADIGIATGLPFTVTEHHGGWLVIETGRG